MKKILAYLNNFQRKKLFCVKNLTKLPELTVLPSVFNQLLKCADKIHTSYTTSLLILTFDSILFALHYYCRIEFGLFWMLIQICIGHLLLRLDLFFIRQHLKLIELQYFVKILKKWEKELLDWEFKFELLSSIG